MAERWTGWLDVLFFLTLAVFVIATRPATPVWWVGLVLALLGYPLWILARLQLGAAFSARARATELVTHGLYAKIHHPVYCFGLVACLGTLLMLQIWIILAIWLALTPIELWRARREERALRDAFGAEYEHYKAGTWF